MGKDLNRHLVKEDKQIISGQKYEQHLLSLGTQSKTTIQHYTPMRTAKFFPQ